MFCEGIGQPYTPLISKINGKIIEAKQLKQVQKFTTFDEVERNAT
jgi:hypothetical protein